MRKQSLRNVQLNFKQASKIFPARYTKLRMPTDLTKIAEKKVKFMTGKEFFKVQNILKRWDEKDYEFYAQRNKSGVKLIPFDVE